MKKLLRKRSMLLVALIVSLCMPVMADTATKNSFYSAPTSKTLLQSDKQIYYLTSKGDSNSSPYCDGSNRLRLYAKNKLTISAESGYVISKIQITFRGSNNNSYTGGAVGGKTVSAVKDGVDASVSKSQSQSTFTVETEADEVVVFSSSYAMQITKITVTYEAKPVGGGDNEGGDVELVDEDSDILEGNGDTPFYIRNKATGLYVKYGGSYGMDAIEGRAAHPFKAYKNNDNTYSLGTIHGYFNSMYSQASLFMDRPKSESNWKIGAVAGESGVYYLLGENERALASVGNIYGILEFRVQDADDIFQRWELVTENELLSEMGKATKANPVDITPVIKGAAFDYADVVEVEEGTPFAPEVRTTLGLPTPPTGEDYRELTYSYVNYWEGFMAFAHYAAMWSDDPSVGSNTNLNGIGLSRNNIRNERVIEQVIEIPLSAGTYTFSYQGFYHARNENGELYVSNSYQPTMSIVALRESDFSELAVYTKYLKNYDDSQIRNLIDVSTSDKGYYVAGMLRDNRENDSYRDSIQFTLTENAIVGFRIHKPRTAESSWFSKCQWMIAFDDFTLVYQGNDNSTLDQAVLYYDRVKAAYLHATNKLYELAGKSYTNCTTVENNACVHWDKWDDAIEGVVTVNGVSPRGNTVTTPTNKFAYLNGTATSNKIDTEKEFLEALAKIEEAYQAALKEHNSHLTDFTGEIGNPSFEMTYEDGSYFKHVIDGNSQTAQIPYWNTVPLLDWHDNIWYEWYHDPTVVMEKGDTSCDGGHYFNSWHSNGHSAVPIQQTITLDKGLYELSALVASSPNQTVFLTADTYHNGHIAEGENSFVDHKLQFLVEEDKTEVTIGAIGGDGDAFNLYDPRHGGFFRADHFRLTRIADAPNGRVRLALEEVKKTALDAYGQEVLNLSDFENMVNNNLVAGDGDTEIKTIFANMKEATLAQKTREADMTWAISNANFELGTTEGWTYTKTTGKNDKGETIETGETGVYPHTKHKASIGADGRFLFNTWDADQTKCKEIYQEITGLRNGTYRLSAMVASSNGNTLTLKAGNVSKEVTCVGDNDMVEVSCEFSITEGPSQKVTIGVYNNGTWYKVDNFRLTYKHHTLKLASDADANDTYKEFKPSDVYQGEDWYTDVTVNRKLKDQLSENEIPEGGKAAMWHSVVLPFDVDAETLATWGKKVEVKELTGCKVSGDLISLIFSDAEGITAGKPCMLRLTDNDNLIGSSSYDEIDVDYVTVKSEQSTPAPTCTSDDATTYKVKFLGVYETSYLPQGAFYISNNKFYKVTNGGNKTKIKPFRAYFVVEDEQGNPAPFARGMRLVTDEDVTGIETADNTEPTVVGIYNLNGMRIDEIQDGVNIIRMSDGTSVKIIMK